MLERSDTPSEEQARGREIDPGHFFNFLFVWGQFVESFNVLIIDIPGHRFSVKLSGDRQYLESKIHHSL